LLFKPKKAVVQTTSKKLDIYSLERVPSSDDTPEMILGATRRTYKDKDGVIFKYTWSSAYPPRGKYTDTNGNQWDDNGNMVIDEKKQIEKLPIQDNIWEKYNDPFYCVWNPDDIACQGLEE